MEVHLCDSQGIRDPDGDGLQNWEDDCDNEAGPASNGGCHEAEARFDVTDFGATPNDASNDTTGFESAMAQAARNGGVTYVPAGTYRIANVQPPSNTDLEVEATATLKKYGTTNGPLFNAAGPNDTTFRNNVHITGVGGRFTMDLYDAGQDTTGIRYRNVRNFSLKNMLCIQNNDNPTQEAPSSRKPCVSFLPMGKTPTNGVYPHPISGELVNIHSERSSYGWGLTQISGGEDVHFSNIASEGGVALRLENFSQWTPIDNLTADGVTCRNGHNAVHVNPHEATHRSFHVQNVVANSCESANSLKNSAQLSGSFAQSTISGVKVIPGNQAQLRDPGSGSFLGAWVVRPSRWCLDNDDTLGYTVKLSDMDCGGLPNRQP